MPTRPILSGSSGSTAANFPPGTLMTAGRHRGFCRHSHRQTAPGMPTCSRPKFPVKYGDNRSASRAPGARVGLLVYPASAPQPPSNRYSVAGGKFYCVAMPPGVYSEPGGKSLGTNPPSTAKAKRGDKDLATRIRLVAYPTGSFYRHRRDWWRSWREIVAYSEGTCGVADGNR
jgi:hypothetical protein